MARVPLVVVLTACSSVEQTITPPEGVGSCSASVIGEGISSEISGNAIFGQQTNSEGMTELVIFLWEGNYYETSFDIITMFRTNLRIPDPGTYEIQDVREGADSHDNFLAGWVFSTPTAFAAFLSVSGTLTITSSSEERISGNFEFSGVLRDTSYGVSTESVTVSGSFTAWPGEIPS
jgi:hypothetical protein